jgi:hypothetical protein
MVLPSISPLSDSGISNPQVNIPPPLRFKPLVGIPKNVSIGAARVQVQIHPGMSAAKANGIRYEWQVYEWLRELMAPLSQPIHIQHCIHFSDDNGYRTVIPDAFTVFHDIVVLFEVKSQHMPETWWQCEKLYKPLLEAIFDRPVFCVEIVKTYDPQMPFPCEVKMIDDLVEWMENPQCPWGVFKWRKKKT